MSNEMWHVCGLVVQAKPEAVPAVAEALAAMPELKWQRQNKKKQVSGCHAKRRFNALLDRMSQRAMWQVCWRCRCYHRRMSKVRIRHETQSSRLHESQRRRRCSSSCGADHSDRRAALSVGLMKLSGISAVPFLRYWLCVLVGTQNGRIVASQGIQMRRLTVPKLH